MTLVRKRDRRKIKSLWNQYAPAAWYTPDMVDEKKVKGLMASYSIKDLRKMAVGLGIDSKLTKLGLARCIIAEKNIFFPDETGNYDHNTLVYMVREFHILPNLTDRDGIKMTNVELQKLLLASWKGGCDELMNVNLQHVLELHEIMLGMEDRFCSMKIKTMFREKNKETKVSFYDQVEESMTRVLDLYRQWMSESDTAKKRKLFEQTQLARVHAENAVTEYLKLIRKHCNIQAMQDCDAENIPAEVMEWFQTSLWDDRVILCNVMVKGRNVQFVEGDQLLPGYVIGIAVRETKEQPITWLGVGKPNQGEPTTTTFSNLASSSSPFEDPTFNPSTPFNPPDIVPMGGKQQDMVLKEQKVVVQPTFSTTTKIPMKTEIPMKIEIPIKTKVQDGTTFKAKAVELLKDALGVGMDISSQLVWNILLGSIFPKPPGMSTQSSSSTTSNPLVVVSDPGSSPSLSSFSSFPVIQLNDSKNDIVTLSSSFVPQFVVGGSPDIQVIHLPPARLDHLPANAFVPVQQLSRVQQIPDWLMKIVNQTPVEKTYVNVSNVSNVSTNPSLVEGAIVLSKEAQDDRIIVNVSVTSSHERYVVAKTVLETVSASLVGQLRTLAAVSTSKPFSDLVDSFLTALSTFFSEASVEYDTPAFPTIAVNLGTMRNMTKSIRKQLTNPSNFSVPASAHFNWVDRSLAIVEKAMDRSYSPLLSPQRVRVTNIWTTPNRLYEFFSTLNPDFVRSMLNLKNVSASQTAFDLHVFAQFVSMVLDAKQRSNQPQNILMVKFMNDIKEIPELPPKYQADLDRLLVWQAEHIRELEPVYPFRENDKVSDTSFVILKVDPKRTWTTILGTLKSNKADILTASTQLKQLGTYLNLVTGKSIYTKTYDDIVTWFTVFIESINVNTPTDALISNENIVILQPDLNQLNRESDSVLKNSTDIQQTQRFSSLVLYYQHMMNAAFTVQVVATVDTIDIPRIKDTLIPAPKMTIILSGMTSLFARLVRLFTNTNLVDSDVEQHVSPQNQLVVYTAYSFIRSVPKLPIDVSEPVVPIVVPDLEFLSNTLRTDPLAMMYTGWQVFLQNISSVTSTKYNPRTQLKELSKFPVIRVQAPYSLIPQSIHLKPIVPHWSSGKALIPVAVYSDLDGHFQVFKQLVQNVLKSNPPLPPNISTALQVWLIMPDWPMPNVNRVPIVAPDFRRIYAQLKNIVIKERPVTLLIDAMRDANLHNAKSLNTTDIDCSVMVVATPSDTIRELVDHSRSNHPLIQTLQSAYRYRVSDTKYMHKNSFSLFLNVWDTTFDTVADTFWLSYSIASSVVSYYWDLQVWAIDTADRIGAQLEPNKLLRTFDETLASIGSEIGTYQHSEVILTAYAHLVYNWSVLLIETASTKADLVLKSLIEAESKVPELSRPLQRLYRLVKEKTTREKQFSMIPSEKIRQDLKRMGMQVGTVFSPIPTTLVTIHKPILVGSTTTRLETYHYVGKRVIHHRSMHQRSIHQPRIGSSLRKQWTDLRNVFSKKVGLKESSSITLRTRVPSLDNEKIETFDPVQSWVSIVTNTFFNDLLKHSESVTTHVFTSLSYMISFVKNVLMNEIDDPVRRMSLIIEILHGFGSEFADLDTVTLLAASVFNDTTLAATTAVNYVNFATSEVLSKEMWASIVSRVANVAGHIGQQYQTLKRHLTAVNDICPVQAQLNPLELEELTMRGFSVRDPLTVEFMNAPVKMFDFRALYKSFGILCRSLGILSKRIELAMMEQKKHAINITSEFRNWLAKNMESALSLFERYAREQSPSVSDDVRFTNALTGVGQSFFAKYAHIPKPMLPTPLVVYPDNVTIQIQFGAPFDRDMVRNATEVLAMSQMFLNKTNVAGFFDMCAIDLFSREPDLTVTPILWAALMTQANNVSLMTAFTPALTFDQSSITPARWDAWNQMTRNVTSLSSLKTSIANIEPNGECNAEPLIRSMNHSQAVLHYPWEQLSDRVKETVESGMRRLQAIKKLGIARQSSIITDDMNLYCRINGSIATASMWTPQLRFCETFEYLLCMASDNVTLVERMEDPNQLVEYEIDAPLVAAFMNILVGEGSIKDVLTFVPATLQAASMAFFPFQTILGMAVLQGRTYLKSTQWWKDTERFLVDNYGVYGKAGIFAVDVGGVVMTGIIAGKLELWFYEDRLQQYRQLLQNSPLQALFYSGDMAHQLQTLGLPQTTQNIMNSLTQPDIQTAAVSVLGTTMADIQRFISTNDLSQWIMSLRNVDRAQLILSLHNTLEPTSPYVPVIAQMVDMSVQGLRDQATVATAQSVMSLAHFMRLTATDIPGLQQLSGLLSQVPL